MAPIEFPITSAGPPPWYSMKSAMSAAWAFIEALRPAGGVRPKPGSSGATTRP